MERERPPRFAVFDPNRLTEIQRRHLPHWFQAGTAVFVTFRTEDSLPKSAVRRMQQTLLDWIKARNLPVELAQAFLQRPAAEYEEHLHSLSPEDRAAYYKQTARLLHWELDSCHGACPFRQPELALIVAEHLKYFDGQRYDLDCFVIMPNHVHAIVQFRPGYDLKLIGQSWQRLSARRINKLLGRSGPVWQREPFDHLIRSGRQFQYLRHYIKENPNAAHLSSGEYYYYENH